MKKIFILLCFLLSITVAGQVPGTFMKVDKVTTPFGRSLPDSTLVFVKNQAAFYMLITASTATNTVQTKIDGNKALAVASGTVSATISAGKYTSLETSSLVAPSVSGDVAIVGGLSSQSLLTGSAIIAGVVTTTNTITAANYNITDVGGGIKVRSSNGDWWQIFVLDGGTISVTTTTYP